MNYRYLFPALLKPFTPAYLLPSIKASPIRYRWNILKRFGIKSK